MPSELCVEEFRTSDDGARVVNAVYALRRLFSTVGRLTPPSLRTTAGPVYSGGA